MRYYVCADPHGFFTELKTALDAQGFFTDPQPHKLLICGDLFDRGAEAVQLQEFLLELMAKDQLILVRGNHEDLAERLLNTWHMESYFSYQHRTNGTVDTVCQLAGCQPVDLYYNSDRIGRRFMNTPYMKKIIPSMVDFYETEHYIFVHGWIPSTPVQVDENTTDYIVVHNWRQADEGQWANARWINGMVAAHSGAVEPGKTVVCGHHRCSFGHANYEGRGAEADRSADYTPYCAPGIIALDACTILSGRVNCIVLED